MAEDPAFSRPLEGATGVWIGGGDQNRLAEPVAESIDALVDQIVPRLLPLFDRPVVIWGHSFGGITAFEPSGSFQHYAFPDLIVTNICFGGADMHTAWITASSTGKLFKAAWPRPGLKLEFNA